jgi:hypothetical protein
MDTNEKADVGEAEIDTNVKPGDRFKWRLDDTILNVLRLDEEYDTEYWFTFNDLYRPMRGRLAGFKDGIKRGNWVRLPIDHLEKGDVYAPSCEDWKTDPWIILAINPDTDELTLDGCFGSTSLRTGKMGIRYGGWVRLEKISWDELRSK